MKSYLTKIERNKPYLQTSILSILVCAFLIGCEPRKQDVEAQKEAIKAFLVLCKGEITSYMELNNMGNSMGFECLVDEEKADVY